jgi:hypothetical protein
MLKACSEKNWSIRPNKPMTGLMTTGNGTGTNGKKIRGVRNEIGVDRP